MVANTGRRLQDGHASRQQSRMHSKCCDSDVVSTTLPPSPGARGASYKIHSSHILQRAFFCPPGTHHPDLISIYRYSIVKVLSFRGQAALHLGHLKISSGRYYFPVIYFELIGFVTILTSQQANSFITSIHPFTRISSSVPVLAERNLA